MNKQGIARRVRLVKEDTFRDLTSGNARPPFPAGFPRQTSRRIPAFLPNSDDTWARLGQRRECRDASSDLRGDNDVPMLSSRRARNLKDTLDDDAVTGKDRLYFPAQSIAGPLVVSDARDDLDGDGLDVLLTELVLHDAGDLMNVRGDEEGGTYGPVGQDEQLADPTADELDLTEAVSASAGSRDLPDEVAGPVPDIRHVPVYEIGDNEFAGFPVRHTLLPLPHLRNHEVIRQMVQPTGPTLPAQASDLGHPVDGTRRCSEDMTDQIGRRPVKQL